MADGVTSTAGGAQASRLAVEAVKATLREPPSRHETLSEWLEFAVLRANEEILFEGKRNPQWEGMSTTIVLAALAGEKLYVMHLGDSRAYLVRDGVLHQLTADHTWAQEALDAGSISTAEASQHPGRNQLLRYLGSQKNISVDRGIIMPGTGQREEYLMTQPSDMVLLCTDGLHHMVAANELKQTAARPRRLSTRCRRRADRTGGWQRRARRHHRRADGTAPGNRHHRNGSRQAANQRTANHDCRFEHQAVEQCSLPRALSLPSSPSWSLIAIYWLHAKH